MYSDGMFQRYVNRTGCYMWLCLCDYCALRLHLFRVLFLSLHVKLKAHKNLRVSLFACVNIVVYVSVNECVLICVCYVIHCLDGSFYSSSALPMKNTDGSCDQFGTHLSRIPLANRAM